MSSQSSIFMRRLVLRSIGSSSMSSRSRLMDAGILALKSSSPSLSLGVGVRSMSSLSDKFTEAQARLKKVQDQGNDVKLKLYGLFKQSTVGKNTTKKPGMMDLVGKAKWEAWNAVGDISQDEAQKKYIELVDSLVAESSAAGQTQTSSGPGLTIEVKDGVRTIRLERPAKKNALTPEMYDAIRDGLRDANTDKATKIVVLTGTGDYFCSGNDLGNFANVTDVKAMAESGRQRLKAYVAAYIDCEKPLIVLVNGPAVGIGVTVLGLADIVYATDKAHFTTPFSALGQSPEACSSYTFPRVMGYAKSSELLFFNTKITAQQAQSSGLVSEIFPEATFKAETEKRVQAWAQLPVKSLVYSKELVRGRERKILHEVNEAECDRLLERWQSQDCMAAIMKFFSKK